MAVAPFAIEEPPPPEARSHPGLPGGPHDVLFGGVYDWYDPLLVVSAWPRVLEAVPTARLIFCESPNPGTTPQVLLSAVKARAAELGLLGSAIHALPWVAFEDRGPWLRSFRAAVVAHRPSLETTLSFRTRVIEALWASLPVVSTPGGAASELLEVNGAGLVVPAGPEALAEALVSVLSNPATHAALVANAARLARSFAPRVALAPLLSFAASPRRLPVSPPATSTARRVLRKVLGRR
ncbi:MAG: glycosyltransferase family 4 protein [Acidobacteria bacterium]|nr:glycosyltransferase family 4 protein [Acidobacteriota bacterium]